MSDALDKARLNLERLLSIENPDWVTEAVEALIDAKLAALSAPETGDATPVPDLGKVKEALYATWELFHDDDDEQRRDLMAKIAAALATLEQTDG